MLASLCVKNFTTVEYIELDFTKGLTSITGETGAGKSVLLDALALALGSRSTKETLRDPAAPAEVTATFYFGTNPSRELTDWLTERELLCDDSEELVLRRTLKPDGRSKAFINSTPVTLADLKHLADLLVDLHSQHEYQSLLKRSTQQQLLDNFSGSQALTLSVYELATQWLAITRKIDRLENAGSEQQAKQQLLSYQVQELDNLAPLPNEVLTLEKEQKVLAKAENLLSDLQQATYSLRNNEATGILDTSVRTSQLLSTVSKLIPEISNSAELLESARIQLDEALSDIELQIEKIVIDPQRLQLIDSRLDALYTVARKHDSNPELLTELHQTLQSALNELENSDEQLESLKAECEQLFKHYQQAADKLSKKRKSGANKLTKVISQKLTALNMAHCQLEIKLQATGEKISTHGNEQLEFLISTIPGKPPASLAKIASGGELSRISLAIQVVTAQTTQTPTLVFDEVDVGIGGATAEVVGNLLRELGEHCQVLCVTHQAQVAAKGHQHLLVSKQLSKHSACTDFTLLNKDLRTRELARMMGGKDITQSTLAHAAEILESA